MARRRPEGARADGAWMAAFPSPDAVRTAMAGLTRAGWKVIDWYTPFDLDAAEEPEAPRTRSWLPLVALIGGTAGAVGAFVIQWWTNARSYPMNVGGRPRPAIPAYIPITFESMILAAAGSVVVAWLLLLGLPRLWAPVDEVDGFEHATLDQFWVQAAPPAGSPLDAAESALRTLGAVKVVRP